MMNFTGSIVFPQFADESRVRTISYRRQLWNIFLIVFCRERGFLERVLSSKNLI